MDNKAVFFICPKCYSAFLHEQPQTSYRCLICGHEWQPPKVILNVAYFATIDEVQTYLVGRGENYELKSLPLVLGRDSDFKLLQQNLSVSRKHFEINFDTKNQSYIITPFKTGGGTYLNGKLLNPEQAYSISSDDELVVSGVVLKLKTKFKVQIPNIVGSDHNYSEIRLHANSELLYINEQKNNSGITTTLSYSDDSIAVLIYNRDIGKWRILSIKHQRISINGNCFIDEILGGGESINLAGYCFVYNEANSCLEPESQNIGVELVAEKLTAGYGSTVILNSLDFSIPKGKLTAILGQSGCGKTTLIKILSGQKIPLKGCINTDKNQNTKYNDWVKTHLAFVPQHDVVHSELTIQQCIEYAAELRMVGTNYKLKKSIVAKTLRDTGLEEYANQKICDLSGGQRKRVNIAVELLGHPDILLLDEPTTGLDFSTEKQIIAELHQLSQQGKTVVFVTHSLSTIEVADYVIVLQKGIKGAYVFAEGSPSEIQKEIGIESWSELYAKIEQKTKKQTTTKNSSGIWGGRLPLIPTQLSRYIAIWFSSPILSSLLLLGFPLLLGLLIRASVSIDAPMGKDRLLFALIAMFWLGINQSVREIVKEKNIFIQERSGHISSSSYLFSKLAFFVIVTLLQSILIALPIMWFNFCRQEGELFLKNQLDYCTMGQVIPMFWIAGVIGIIVGLLISASSMFFNKGEITSVLLSVLITLPQILFSNKNMPRELIDVLKPEQYYKFIMWHEQATRLTEFLSFFTFSRYLYVPLDAIVTRQSDLVIRKALLFNCGILFMFSIIALIISWLLLEIYTVWVSHKQ